MLPHLLVSEKSRHKAGLATDTWQGFSNIPGMSGMSDPGLLDVSMDDFIPPKIIVGSLLIP